MTAKPLLDFAWTGSGSSGPCGSVTFLPGSSLEYAPVGVGIELSFSTGWAPVVVALVVFVLVARPWRAVVGISAPAGFR